MDENQATHVDAQRNQVSQKHSDQYKGPHAIKVFKLKHVFNEVSDAEKTANFWSQAMVYGETDRDQTGIVFHKFGRDHHAIGLNPEAAGQRPENGEAIKVEHLDLEIATMDFFRVRGFTEEDKFQAHYREERASGERGTIFL